MGKVDYGQSPKRAIEPILANHGQTNWWVVQIYPMAGLVIVHFSRPVCSPLMKSWTGIYYIANVNWKIQGTVKKLVNCS